MSKIAKMFIVRKYLDSHKHGSMRALPAPYSIEKLKETLETTRRLTGANVEAEVLLRPIAMNIFLESDGTFVCVWEDGATMHIKCAKRRSTLERWRIASCSEITRNGETLECCDGISGAKRPRRQKCKNFCQNNNFNGRTVRRRGDNFDRIARENSLRNRQRSVEIKQCIISFTFSPKLCV